MPAQDAVEQLVRSDDDRLCWMPHHHTGPEEPPAVDRFARLGD